MDNTEEKVIEGRSGWAKLIQNLIAIIGGIGLSIFALIMAETTRQDSFVLLLIIAIPSVAIGGVCMAGFFTLQPNEARLLLLFGEYKGTVLQSGFFWTNPLYTKKRISRRTRNFEGTQIKVNDKRGNPIEISAVIVWRVVDTAKALFNVDDYINFVKVQSESALRHLANEYPYDPHDEDSQEITLRNGGEEVNQALQMEVQARLSKAGVEIEEARLNHLAYATEIAAAMLRRQQAEAVIAARTKIVHGAVSMVDMALTELSEHNVVDLDEERKAAMVSNLLVVLCGEHDANPVINTGTLHN